MYEPRMQKVLNTCVMVMCLCWRCLWAAWKEVPDWLRAGEWGLPAPGSSTALSSP